MAPPKSKLDPSTLVSYSHAAAGHDGVRSDPTGAILIKPCTRAEVDFYESSAAGHPAFREFMPKFMGTLTAGGLDGEEIVSAAAMTATAATEKLMGNSKAGGDEGKGPAEDADEEGRKEGVNWVPSGGKKLDTGLSIVLENATAGFKRPNVIDLKLGARLWDDDAPEAKRRRLDEVTNTTTSGSLGFRIAGMRVYRPSRNPTELARFAKHVQPGDDGYLSYDKLFGQSFKPGDIQEAFVEYLGGKETFKQSSTAKEIAKRLAAKVSLLASILENEESRFYSSSVLAVYEGDEETLRAALEQEGDEAKTDVAGSKGQDLPDEDDEDEDEQKPRVCDMRMIDFAHAQWTPGQGPDRNVLQGIKSVHKLFEQLATEA